MSNRMNKQQNKKTIVGLLVLFTLILVGTTSSLAANYTRLEIYPENVGVFLSTGEQQFVCFGVTATGARENITDKVDWISSNEDLVKINQYGLAKIVLPFTPQKRPQVKVTCNYPKTGGGGAGPGTTNLLLLDNTPRVRQ